MKILWFSWKDIKNPLAGGAEYVHDEILSRCVKEHHEVILLSARFPGSKQEEQIHGYTVIRVGNRYFVYIAAFIYFIRHLRKWPEVIIEEINTMPFMTQFYAKQKRVLVIHQLCKSIWFYNMIFPLSIVGYIAEYIFLHLLSQNNVLTISESTRQDLMTYGFKEKNIRILPLGIQIDPIPSLSQVRKYPQFTLLSLGAMRNMKQTDHHIRAFDIAKKSIPQLRLIVAGDSSGEYGKSLIKMIHQDSDIIYLGKVTAQTRKLILEKSHIVLATSVKEGWGLVPSEANSQGTIAVSYNVDGLRDSVKDNETGLLTKENTPRALAEIIVKLYNDPDLYKRLQEHAYKMSKNMNFDDTYKTFMKMV